MIYLTIPVKSVHWLIGNIAAKKTYKELYEQWYVEVDLSGVQPFMSSVFQYINDI